MQQELSETETLSKVCLSGDSGVSVDSRIFLSVENGDYTYFYCCNNKGYKCLTSALVLEYFNVAL
jgi:hypothetical protein